MFSPCKKKIKKIIVVGFIIIQVFPQLFNLKVSYADEAVEMVSEETLMDLDQEVVEIEEGGEEQVVEVEVEKGGENQEGELGIEFEVTEEEIESEKPDLIQEEMDEVVNEEEVEIQEIEERTLTTEIEVSNWDEFKAGYNNSEVTKISFLGDITPPSNQRLTDRKTSIEIEGRGYTLNLYPGQSLPVSAPGEDEKTPIFHIHNIHLGVVGVGDTNIYGSYSFIAGYEGSYNTYKWKFRLGNITNDSRITRILRGSLAEVTLYGNLDLNTKGENFYVGSLIIEEGTTYNGHVSTYDYSIIWYPEDSALTIGSTGSKKEVRVGRYANVNLTKAQKAGTNFPAIYQYWSNFVIENGAKVAIDMPGRALTFAQSHSQVTVQDRAVLDLRSMGSNQVLSFFTLAQAPQNCSLVVEAGGSLFVTGNTKSGGVIDMSGIGHQLILNNPRAFDLRNNEQAAILKLGTHTVFSVSGSHLNLWKLNTMLHETADFSYFDVSEFKLMTASLATNHQIISTDENLKETFNHVSNYRRFTGDIPQQALTLVAPTSISFGEELKISPKDMLYPIVEMTDLGVIDTHIEKCSWQVGVQVMDEFYNQEYGHTLPLVFKKQGEMIPLTSQQVMIYESTNSDENLFSISSTWYKEGGDGLYLEVKKGEARVGEYSGNLKWTLSNVPENA